MNKQSKKLIHGYLSWLLKHEQVIRSRGGLKSPYKSGSVVHNPQYGLCANVYRFARDRTRLYCISFDDLNNKWSYFTGRHTFPVPQSLDCKDKHRAAIKYNISGPFIMWCEGPYADARWAYIRFLHEELSKCP